MTAAAFRAEYSDWKLIKTRSAIQLVFEIPLERESEAYDVLGGMPKQGETVWCAIARLNPEQKEAPTPVVSAKPGPATHSKPGRERTLAEYAGIMSNDPRFWAFCREHFGYGVEDGNDAAREIRLICGVASRRDILPDTPSGRVFNDLRSRFKAWATVPV